MTNATDAPNGTNHPKVVASHLLHAGAILSVNDDETYLVGHLVWIGRGRVFWFAANGDDPKQDGHLLVFDTARVERNSAITFMKKDRVVARLTSIDECGLADADDFRAAWQIWQQRRPRCDRLIGASLNLHLARGSRM